MLLTNENVSFPPNALQTGWICFSSQISPPRTLCGRPIVIQSVCAIKIHPSILLSSHSPFSLSQCLTHSISNGFLTLLHFPFPPHFEMTPYFSFPFRTVTIPPPSTHTLALPYLFAHRSSLSLVFFFLSLPNSCPTLLFLNRPYPCSYLSFTLFFLPHLLLANSQTEAPRTIPRHRVRAENKPQVFQGRCRWSST